MIDEIISDNADDLRAALLAAFKKNPIGFWTKYGFPLVPTAILARVESADGDGGFRWASLRETVLEDGEFRRELRALREDFPGQDSRILDMLVAGIPPKALRLKLDAPLPLPPTTGGS